MLDFLVVAIRASHMQSTFERHTRTQNSANENDYRQHKQVKMIAGALF